jgi:hypothetical protein
VPPLLKDIFGLAPCIHHRSSQLTRPVEVPYLYTTPGTKTQRIRTHTFTSHTKHTSRYHSPPQRCASGSSTSTQSAATASPKHTSSTASTPTLPKPTPRDASLRRASASRFTFGLSKSLVLSGGVPTGRKGLTGSVAGAGRTKARVRNVGVVEGGWVFEGGEEG